MDTVLRFESCDIASETALLFAGFTWQVNRGENWWVTGPNGSGKSALATALRGLLQVSGSFTVPPKVRVVSFETLREVIFRERYFDESDFVEGGVHQGTTARLFIWGHDPSDHSVSRESVEPDRSILSQERFELLVDRLAIRGLLDRGLKFLSTGEIRKVLMCRALLSRPGLIVFDEPFAGLDGATRLFVAELLGELAVDDQGPGTIVLSDRADDMPAHITHVLALDKAGRPGSTETGDGHAAVKLRIAFSGSRADFEAFARSDAVFAGIAGFAGQEDESAQALELGLDRGSLSTKSENSDEEPLVILKDINVSYGDRRVFEDFSWTLEQGQHTLVRGPNGCGKSTLLNVITGDNPQVYANDVTVLGYKRGSGESIWEVKAGLGYVSYQSHIEYIYRCDSNLEEVVVSGFYDSIGLYATPGWSESQTVRQWLEVMGLSDKARASFLSLSYGEQRAALIARAMVKMPRLLILDECCHGLDPLHRRHVLSIADYIGSHTATTILYVTHAPDERLGCTRRVIDFVAEADGNGGEPRYRPVQGPAPRD